MPAEATITSTRSPGPIPPPAAWSTPTGMLIEPIAPAALARVTTDWVIGSPESISVAATKVEELTARTEINPASNAPSPRCALTSRVSAAVIAEPGGIVPFATATQTVPERSCKATTTTRAASDANSTGHTWLGVQRAPSRPRRRRPDQTAPSGRAVDNRLGDAHRHHPDGSFLIGPPPTSGSHSTKTEKTAQTITKSPAPPHADTTTAPNRSRQSSRTRPHLLRHSNPRRVSASQNASGLHSPPAAGVLQASGRRVTTAYNGLVARLDASRSQQLRPAVPRPSPFRRRPAEPDAHRHHPTSTRR